MTAQTVPAQPWPARLEGSVALVTGAGSGIGAGVMRRFVREGARVVAMGRGADRLREAVEPLGPAVVAMPGDVTDPADCRDAVDLALSHFGKLDVLVPNAGMYDQNAALSQLSLEELEAAYAEVFTVNVKGALLTVHAALPALIESRGSIIFTGSISSLQAGFGGALYVPSKHAVAGLAKQLAFELAGRVRVNTVAAGYVTTDLVGPQALGGGSSLPDVDRVVHRLPTGFAPGPDDIAGVYAMLASRMDGAAVTGAVFSVDSGQPLWGPPRPDTEESS
ncbi:SDR family NAD(P)-dependent oxidoreductase [Amycolatopsis rhabdoformis]|uniref:SDR family NAD(P)-dependent oxidoreductase n=1 Tax=Amycolatopsis rhabdoformis TaxID=1448059 RepID=A0ABZ1HVQ5_9PSEU|nr:SDR family NAD(P)-dependent oxidoreductase [Amycolatopsis rhabdoformis]WSE26308.1 SDR family NAD(P)-dependent oxidoreductase [Amycolatopsis rhabdoformis]